MGIILNKMHVRILQILTVYKQIFIQHVLELDHFHMGYPHILNQKVRIQSKETNKRLKRDKKISFLI